jgi:hypothetical protein
LAKKMDAISTPAKKAPSKIASGTNGTVKKTPAANGTAKKPVAAPRKL